MLSPPSFMFRPNRITGNHVKSLLLCRLKAGEGAGLRKAAPWRRAGRSLRGRRLALRRALRSHLSARKISCSFFRRKSQRRPRGENGRETYGVSLKRAPVAGLRHIRAASTVAARQSSQAASALACGPSLQANRPRFFTLAAVRFFFRHFHIAKPCRPPACRGNDTATTRVRIRLFRRPLACTIALRKVRKKWRRRRERPERVCETAKSFVPAQ